MIASENSVALSGVLPWIDCGTGAVLSPDDAEEVEVVSTFIMVDGRGSVWFLVGLAKLLEEMAKKKQLVVSLKDLGGLLDQVEG